MASSATPVPRYMPPAVLAPAGQAPAPRPRPRRRRAVAPALAPAVTQDLLDHLGVGSRYPWSPRWQGALETCPRSFYWEAVAARNVTRGDTPTRERRRAWTLQHLVTLPQLTARLVRSAIRQIVGAVACGDRPPRAERVIDGVCITLDGVWTGSTNAEHHGRFWRGPDTYPALQEFLVGPGLPESARDEARTRIVTAIKGLSQSPILDAVRAARRFPVHIGSLFPEPVPIGSAVLGWVSPELIYNARPPRRSNAPAQWVLGAFEVDSHQLADDPGRRRRREIACAAAGHWVAGLTASQHPPEAPGAPPPSPIPEVRTVHLDEEGRMDTPRPLTASDALRLAGVTDAYATAMAAAGAAPRTLEGAAIEAFPMAPTPARCRVCRFAPLCDVPTEKAFHGRKVVQPAIPSLPEPAILGRVPPHCALQDLTDATRTR